MVDDDLRKKILDKKPTGPVSGIIMNEISFVSATVADMKKVIAANPNHPISKSFISGIKTFDDTKVFTLERTSIEAILDDGEVLVEQRVEDNQIIVTKKVINKKVTAKKPETTINKNQKKKGIPKVE